MNNLNFQNMNMMAPRGGNGVGLQQTILAHYRNQQKIPTGWQQSVPPEERAGLTIQLLSMIRMLKPELSEPEVIRQAISLENSQFLQSPSKDQYSTQMKQRLQTLTALRQRRAATMQNNINNAMTPAQMGMMGQPGLQPPRQNTPQQFNPGFPNPQLQRPMQPSPIPMSQGSSAMGINSTNLNQQQGQNGQQPGAQQIQQPRQQIDNAAIMRLTRKLVDSATEEMKQKFTADVANWPPERRQQLMNQNIDPVTWRYRQHAEMLIRTGRVPGTLLQGPQAINQAGGGVQQPGQPNQMPNQMNQRPPGQDFDFNAIANQQIEALRVQDQGQQVVPASNNANGAQMVGFSAQPQQPGQAQSAALAQQRQAYQNATLQRQAQVQAQQAQAQARAQQHMQQQQAQAAQARNTNQMLTGMNGGLNQPPGAGQSPAMPMLNRPMVPPGQTGPTTPQQQPQNHVPRMTPQDPQASQLMREAQQQQRAQIAMASQGQPLTDQLRMSMIPPEIPPEVKQQLLRAQEPQFRAYIANYYTSRGRTPLQNAQFPAGKPAIGQPNMGMNPTQALQMGQMGLSNQMMNGNNLGNLVRGPGISPGQQAPNGINAQQLAMAQRPGGIPQNQRLANAQALLQQSPGIIKTTDGRPFPPNVITAQIKQNIPPDVKTWAQLKQWVTQNSNLAPNLEVQKLLLLQVLHFQDLMRHSHIQQQQQQNALVGGNLQQQNNAGGMAATAPMGPGAIQQQPNMANMAHVASLAAQVTPQEIAAFRSRLNPQQLATASDQQLRMLITQQKMNARQQQQAFMNLQAQRNQVPQPQPVMPGSGAAGARPPPSQLQVTQPTQATPQPKPANKPPQPSKAAQSTTQVTMNKGVKRSSDDAAESTTETSAANVAPQAPAMIPTKSQQGVGNLTPEKLSKLTPSQRAQLLKVQDASGAKSTQRSLPPQQELQARMKDPAREQRYRVLLAEEDKNTPRGPPVQISPEARAQLQQLIREKLTHIRKVEQALRIFLAGYEGGEGIEDLARSVIKAWILLLRQINQSDGTLQEQLTINEADFKQNARHILSFVVKVMSSMQNQQGQKTVVTQGQQPQTTQAQAQAARQPQLNAANLKINEAQQRQQKAPQAPTTDRPPFQIGGQSPRGVPTYFETAPKVSTNLVLPEKKRQKVDGQAATPSTKASPHIGANKGTSPDLKRQSQPERPMEQRQTFKCKAADCDYSARGFDTQAELDAHVGSLHTRVDDPLQFALDSVAEFLDVDPKTGQAKSDPNAASRVAKPPAVAARTLQPVKSGQTPNIPHSVTTPAGAQSAATPMTRVPTQTGIKSSPSTSLLKTPQTGAKATTPSTGAPGKATPSSVKPIPKEPELITVPQPDQVEDLQPLIPASLFDFSYDDIYAALDTNDPFTTLDIKDEDNSWILRSRPSSPMNTPDSSSKDTPSTRQSDISENDNLQINLDVKDVDMPDAWLAAALDGSSLPLDVQLSEDLQTLGVALPPMDDSDMMLFYGDNALLDLEAMGSMENMATLDPAVFG